MSRRITLTAAGGTWAWIAAAAAILQLLRLSGWQTRRICNQPILWVLHLGYFWIVAGLTLKAAAGFWGLIPASAATHALTAGAIGTQTVVSGTSNSPGVSGAGGPDSYPDAVIKLEYDQSWGHLGLGGVFRNLEVDTGAGGQDSAFGWGFLAGLWAPTFGDDSLNAHFVIGEGVGRYILGSFYDAEVTSFRAGLIPEIDPIAVYAFHVGYQHWWTDSLASNAIFGWAHTEIDVTDAFGPGIRAVGVAAGTNENVQSIHANILWYPADPVTIGIEYIWGARHTISGGFATNNRVQMGFWYTF